MPPEDPYQTRETGEPQPPAVPRFVLTHWDPKTRALFIVPGLLFLFSGFLFAGLHRIGIPTPEKDLLFFVTATLASVFSTRHVVRRQSATRPTILLIFLSHLVLQVIAIFGLAVLIMVASNIL